MPVIPYSRKWTRILSNTFGEQYSAVLLSRAQALFDSYRIEQSSGLSKSNRVLLHSRVLPGLAIYKALLETNQDRKCVLEQTEKLFRAAFFTLRMKGIRVLNLLPDPFPIVKPVLKMMFRDEYLPDSQEVIQDNIDCYAINVYRCFTLDTLKAHDAAELTPLFCNTDDWLAEMMPKVRWLRTGTIGRGNERRDFRWYRHL